MKINAQIDTKSDAKIDVWAIRGPTFEVLGHVFRNAFFNDLIFEVCKNLSKIIKVRHSGGQKRSGC